MTSRKKQTKKEEDGIKMLQRRYAKWKEQHSPDKRWDYDEILKGEPDELDLEKKQYLGEESNLTNRLNK